VTDVAPLTLHAVLARIDAAGIRLRNRGGELGVAGSRGQLDPELLAALREHKAELLERVGSGGEWWTPPPIRPEMLPLVDLTQAEIDRVVAAVPGGAANVRDIYPLAPLQEGFLFHYLLASQGDPYLLRTLSSFASRERLDAYLEALRAVVARHDILRTSIAWEDLPEPVQVVWREAPLLVEEVAVDAGGGDVAGELYRRFDPRHHRIDLRQAPLMRGYVAHDAAEGRWVLLLLRHHLIGDHTTQEVLREEIEAFLRGQGDRLPAPLPFRNYIAQTRLGVSREEHRRFFTELLGDVDQPTAPFGLLDVRGDGSEMEEARLAVDEGLAARLRARARALGVSAASVFHLAWAQVLARVSARDDVVFGTVLFGRMHGGEGSDRVVGPFINMLPIRIRVGEVGVEESVRQTHALLAALMRHEHASLALAQRCSAVEPSAPLFTAPLNYRHSGRKPRANAPAAAAPPAAGGMRRLGEERTNYPLTLTVDDLGDGFRLRGQVTHESLDPVRVCDFMNRALEGLVEALETAPERPVGSIDVLPASERARVVEEWNRTEADYASGSCIHQLFERQAQRAPSADALLFGGERVSYGELNARANRLARHLRSLGVGPDVRVAISVERGVEMVAALLAVLKAGGAYVPLDPAYPEDRLRWMLEDSAPAALLTQTSLAGRFADLPVPVLELDAAVQAWAGESAVDPERGGLTPGHLAYVIYTSGSTGRPKGVLVPHRGLCNVAAAQQRAFGVGPGDRVLQFASLSFDAAAFELVMALASGAALCLAPREELLPGPGLLGVLRKHGVTTVTLPPSALSALPVEELPALRTITVAGEALPAELVARWGARYRLWNLYGPTEATIWSTAVECSDSGRKPDIGGPIANVRAYVLDAGGEPLPVGVAGELYLGGAGVARGYLGRPGLTAERFVPDPFGGEAGARLYRTGDRARWTADGRLDFIGRVDHQVKVRGFRIELGEIEARLGEHPQVRQAVVVAREDVPGETRLVAYVIGDEAAGADVLRAYLADTLPEHMVPAAYLHLRELPLTPSGKVDRKALPAPEGDAFAHRAYEAPVGDTEELLAEMWSEVLGVERVGRWDDFFDLGGHSLLAVQVISRVQQVLKADIEVAELFTWPVLADFARELNAAAWAELPPIQPAPRDGRLPLSFAQQRLWFLEQLGDQGSTYHIPVRLRLRGTLDRAALVRALDRVIARHEALRTTFPATDGVPEQRIAPANASGFQLAEVELDGQAEGALERAMAEEARAPFDLARGPLIRGRLVRVAADDHVLLLTMHHIVSDGWSMGVFTRELSALYAAFREGREAELPELPVQYADYAAWQRRWVEGEVLQEQADYWKRTLAGAPELLELPADRPRPAQVNHAGALLRLELDEELTTGLKALSRRHGTTLFMTLLAGWAATLGRLSGQAHVVVGTPTAGRGRREIEGLIGFFINTLALRVEMDDAPTVAGLLERVKTRALEAQHHQDIPFEQVVELVDPARSLAHTPIFQVMFTWQNTPRGGLALPGLSADSMRSGSAQVQAKFDLALSLQEAGERIVGGVTYATALFDRDTVARYAGYLRRVLEEMAADDARTVDRLALMPASERTWVLEEWNGTDAAYPADSAIPELFEAQVERTPDATAVVFAEDHVSYAELNRRANRLAHHLRSLGVGPDVRVGICVERSLEMMVGLLALLKAGGAYVPLDPGYPAERLAYMLEDSAPAAVLTQSHLRDRVDVAGVPVIELDDASAWASEADTNPGRGGLTPDHLAYVMYTSGSTGRPKGVAVRQRNVVNRLTWMQRDWGLAPGDAILQSTTLSFDVSVYEVLWPISVGGRVVLARADGQMDPGYLVDAIQSERINIVNFVPSMLQLFLEHPQVERCTYLHRAPCGGEALSPTLARRFRERLPWVSLHNRYGPTEAAASVTMRVEGQERGGSPVPIGRPVANTRVYVLDARGEPVPVGVAGELYIGGVGVGRGYLDRPEQTAERFVADPFSREPGARLYRTGDLARWLADGTVEFLGRTDFQVKVRGFRIELGEIEGRLAAHPGVRDAVVLAREDVPGDKRLVAYVVGDADTESLRAHLAAALPEYMVPAAYVRLEQLPLTPNGKLDRDALPAPEASAYAAREYEAPVGETEAALAEIWAEVLRLDRVGRWDDFFDLGGHSLLAVQVISRVRQVLEVEVALGQVFTRPVLKDFARELETAAQAPLPPVEPVARDGRVPLSFAQARLWFLDRLGGLGSAYHIHKRVPFRGELHREALVCALGAIVARHEALRTVFAEVDGVPEQRIAPAGAGFHLVEHDLGGEDDRRAALDRLAAEETDAPFDLERGPLIRGRLVRLAADHHVLLVTMHHIVSDGWSMEVLARELGALYAAFQRGEPSPLPALPVQYADYAVWQRRWVAGEVLREQADYWARTLAGAPELLELPIDHPRPARMDHAGAQLGMTLDTELTEGLKALSRRHGTTLFMTLLAAWATMLGRLSGQDEVVIGTPTANRGRREIEGLIGFFVNTLAVRVDLHDAPTVAELLGRVKRRALEAQHNQDIPFEQVVERVDPARSLAHTPLFQVMFAWQNTPGGDPGQPAPTQGAARRPARATAQFDLSLTLVERGGRITGGVEYRTALFEQETVERYLGYLRRLLEEMVAGEGRSVARLELMPPAERGRVVDEWNATDVPCPEGWCLHELFERRAEETPGGTAVVFEGGNVTYAQLNARANRLAHHLRSLGVGPDARVAVCAERTPEMVAGLLAVLKAGGAYVPLDPAYPEERLRYLLEDSAPVAVLTQAHLRRRVESAGVPVIELDAASPEWAGGPDANPERGALLPEHLAYVIYTSGSTGRPKGVMVAHRSVHRLVAAVQAGFGLRTDDRSLQFASVAFDASVEEIFGALLTGALLVLRTEAWLEGAHAFWRRCEENGVTVVDLPTRFWQLLVGEPSAPIPPCVRLVVIGGEAVDPAALGAWFGISGHRPLLLNTYGPTEATVDATLREVTADPATWRSIGGPVANTRVYVLDRRGEPVPTGVAGEVYIGGAQVARGYLDRPALTAERFVPDPFAAGPGARLYRTGDLGRWLADGTIEYLGRTDFQVKIRGFRIEPGEIEARLAEHPQVREAVVVAREDAPGDTRLVAYVVGDEAAGADVLRAHLAATLPEHMVPAAYVRLSALPLTPTGKLDRPALPAPEGEALAREYEAPQGEVEVALAEIWAGLLGVERVGRGDDFFALGGHSLLAVQVVSRVRQAMEVEIALGVVFESPVLAALAERILDLQLARFDPETLARLAERVREDGGGTAPGAEDGG